MTSSPEPWQAIAERKRNQRASKIPKKWLVSSEIQQSISSVPAISLIQSTNVLSEEELRWTDPSTHDATSLLQQLAASKISSVDLTRAFIKRAAVAHQLTNCLTEIRFEEAIAQAEKLDEHIKTKGTPLGPLHGLPISFKDSFNIEGYDTSLGITSLCFDPAKKSSLLYEILTTAGAIVIAKTTVPQTLLTSDTDSIVFGRTVNPYNPSFGASGSSGGEGALVALGGSALGVGTDGAGSVRMPAAVNGIVGYKPSGYRLPLDVRPVFGPGISGTSILGGVTVPGFLGRSVRDMQLFTKLVADSEPWLKNPFLYPHPWLNVSAPEVKKLRIGVWSSNGFLNLHPPVRRGLNTASDSLRKAGVQVVEFKGPDISEVWELQKEWMEIQDLSYWRELLSKEPHTDIVKNTAIITKEKEPPALTLEYLHSLNARIANLVREMHNAWTVDDEPIDALLWVTAPHTAVPFDKYTYLGFTGLFNLIDWPATALPLGTFVDKSVDLKVPVEPLNDLDSQIQSLYDPATFHGLPLNVHLIGRRFDDEKLLAISELVHNITKAT